MAPFASHIVGFLAYVVSWLLVSVHLGIDHHPWPAPTDHDRHHSTPHAPDPPHAFDDHSAIAWMKPVGIRLQSPVPEFAAWIPPLVPEYIAPTSRALEIPETRPPSFRRTSPRGCRSPPRA